MPAPHPSSPIHIDYVGIEEVVSVEPIVVSFSIVCDIAHAWPRRAPMHRHLPLVVLMDEGGRNHQHSESPSKSSSDDVLMTFL
jgi:hypothetical protein